MVEHVNFTISSQPLMPDFSMVGGASACSAPAVPSKTTLPQLLLGDLQQAWGSLGGRREVACTSTSCAIRGGQERAREGGASVGGQACAQLSTRDFPVQSCTCTSGAIRPSSNHLCSLFLAPAPLVAQIDFGSRAGTAQQEQGRSQSNLQGRGAELGRGETNSGVGGHSLGTSYLGGTSTSGRRQAGAGAGRH